MWLLIIWSLLLWWQTLVFLCPKILQRYDLEIELHQREVLGEAGAAFPLWQEALDALEAHVTAWPCETQLALYERKTRDIISGLKTVEVQEKFAEYWAFAKPFQLPDEHGNMAPFDIRKPCLGGLQISDAARVSTFRQQFYIEVMLPEVLNGEHREMKVAWLAHQALAAIEADLHEDISSDKAVECLSEMSGVCKALIALLTEDVLAKMEAQEQLEWFKKQGAELNHKNPVSVLSNAITDVASWKERLSRWGQISKAMLIVKDTLEELTDFLGTYLDETEAGIKQLTDQCQSMTVLAEQLPPCSLEKMLEALWSRVASCIEKYLVQGSSAVSLQVLGELLREADLCFPMEERLKEAQQILAELLVKVSGDSKVLKMMEALESVPLVDAAEAALDVEKQVIPLLRLGKEAQGVGLSDEQKAVLCCRWDSWAEMMEKRDDMSDDCFMMEVETLQVLASFLDKDARRTQTLESMNVQHLLQFALKDFVGENTEVKAMAAADDKRKKMGQLMRATCKAEAELEKSTWGRQSLNPRCNEAKKIVAEASAHWLQVAKSELVAVTAEVKQVSGGMQNGEVWCDGFTKKTAWDALAARAEETLLQHAPDSWDAPLSQLEQARHHMLHGGTLDPKQHILKWLHVCLHCVNSTMLTNPDCWRKTPEQCQSQLSNVDQNVPEIMEDCCLSNQKKMGGAGFGVRMIVPKKNVWLQEWGAFCLGKPVRVPSCALLLAGWLCKS